MTVHDPLFTNRATVQDCQRIVGQADDVRGLRVAVVEDLAFARINGDGTVRGLDLAQGDVAVCDQVHVLIGDDTDAVFHGHGAVVDNQRDVTCLDRACNHQTVAQQFQIEQTLGRTAATQSDGASASARSGHVDLTAGRDIRQIRRPHIHTLVRGADVGGRDAEQTLYIDVPTIHVGQAWAIDIGNRIAHVAAGRQAADRGFGVRPRHSHRRQRQIAALGLHDYAIACDDQGPCFHGHTAHRSDCDRPCRRGDRIGQGQAAEGLCDPDISSSRRRPQVTAALQLHKDAACGRGQACDMARPNFEFANLRSRADLARMNGDARVNCIGGNYRCLARGRRISQRTACRDRDIALLAGNRRQRHAARRCQVKAVGNGHRRALLLSKVARQHIHIQIICKNRTLQG